VGSALGVVRRPRRQLHCGFCHAVVPSTLSYVGCRTTSEVISTEGVGLTTSQLIFALQHEAEPRRDSAVSTTALGLADRLHCSGRAAQPPGYKRAELLQW
jgi:hypothetical protein